MNIMSNADNVYLKELHAVSRQNLLVTTQQSIAKQLSSCDNAEPIQTFEQESNTDSTLKSKENSTCRKNVKKTKKVLITCPQEGCGRQFVWLTHYKYHVRMHSGIKPFNCQMVGCGRSFNTQQMLTVHWRTHTGEKPFVCNEEGCGKNFNTAGNLKNHIRTHSGERPFACSINKCGRRFAEASSLKKHLTVHSGKKPYSCNICGKVFSQISSRNVHVRRHYASKDQFTAVRQFEKLRQDITDDEEKMLSDKSQESFNLQVVFPSECIAMPTTTTSNSTSNVLVLAQPQEVMMISSMCLQTDDISQVICGTKVAFAVDELDQIQNVKRTANQLHESVTNHKCVTGENAFED